MLSGDKEAFLRSVYLRFRFMTEITLGVGVKALATLSEAGVPTLLLKGAGLIRGAPQVRTCVMQSSADLHHLHPPTGRELALHRLRRDRRMGSDLRSGGQDLWPSKSVHSEFKRPPRLTGQRSLSSGWIGGSGYPVSE
jgi:hypothetical protein